MVSFVNEVYIYVSLINKKVERKIIKTTVKIEIIAIFDFPNNFNNDEKI
jgi:hypothetical protein